MEALRPGALATVGLIAAPAGYGKTTLLAEVAADARRTPFAWLTVEEQDNDPVRLVTALAAALARNGAIDAGSLGRFQKKASPAAASKRLVAALSDAGPIGLAVDDLHLLTSERSVAVLEAVAQHLPPRSRLLLASRKRLPDVLAAPHDGLRLIELGPEDLRMSESEAGLLFKAAGLDLTEEAVRALTERMEGWPTGLYLAALVLETDAGAASTFDGSDRYVRDYFREECLSRLEDDEVVFLERASMLDRLTGALCDHALRVSGSATRLQELARSNLFVIPAPSGRSRRTYRLHTAFREALRSELQRLEPSLAQSIAARAAGWSKREGDQEQAVAYAWTAGRADEFAELVDASALALYHAGGLATIEQWLSWPEERLLARHPRLAAWSALVQLLRGHEENALQWLDVAEQATSALGTSPDGAPLEAWCRLLRAAMCPSGLETMREEAALALEALDDGSPWRPAARLLLGVTYVLAGETAVAEEMLSEAQTTAAISGAKDTFCVALAQRSLLEAENGHWTTAEAFATNARSVVQESRLDDYPTSALTFAASARSAVQRSDWVRARTDVERATRVLPMLSLALPWLAVQVRLELARARLELSEHGAAEEALAQAEDLLAHGPDLGTLGARAEELRRELDRGSRPADRWERLTPAELRLLPLLTTHLSFREIAELLGISRNTVKTQAICVYRKLGVSSRSAAIERASELGLVEKPEVLELSRVSR
jgi:LuxR family maltose regulon positive regulatory protein